MSTHTPHRTRRWIEDWRPEDAEFWETTGRSVARRNLIWSIFAEHLGFSVWLIWSVSSAFLVATGFDYTPQQLFLLVALPNLVGSLLRLPYTFAVPKFGGRNLTMASAALLLIPTLGFAYAVQRPETPYWVFCLIAATAGLGGGNFASSMANINFFYPSAKKGAALGLNAAGGNLGVSLIQLFLPVIVGGAGIFGLVKASEGGIDLQRAAWVYAGLAIVATLAAYFFMDNLSTAKSSPREQMQVVRKRQTWIMAFLYIGTFGSFIGYSAAMPLLIKLNFWVPEPAPLGTGIYFAYFAFLGALRRLGHAAVRRLAGRPPRWREGHARRVRGDGRVHPRRAVDADAAHPQPDRRPGDRVGQPVVVPVVPGLLPLRLRRDRHRQRLDVQDDPGDLAHRGRAGHRRRARRSAPPPSWPAPSRPPPRSA